MHNPPKSKDHLKTKTQETTRRRTNLEQWRKSRDRLPQHQINKCPSIKEMRLGFLSNRINANETPTWDAGSSHQMTDSPKLYGSAEKRHPSTVPPRASWQNRTKAHSCLPLNQKVPLQTLPCVCKQQTQEVRMHVRVFTTVFLAIAKCYLHPNPLDTSLLNQLVCAGKTTHSCVILKLSSESDHSTRVPGHSQGNTGSVS